MIIYLMREWYVAQIFADLKKKMIFLSGPRQVGKTHLAKSLMEKFDNPVYLNYDNAEDRKIIKKFLWPQKTDFIVFDEIHKMPQWKNYLKGVYDTKPAHLKMLVTGSARLETFRKGGDSLTGRYFALHLFPFSPAEFIANGEAYDADKLFAHSGFPEPYYAADAHDVDRWRNQYLDTLIRGEVLDLERIGELKALEHLTDLLRARIGSPLSYRSLAEDLSISPNTVRRYVDILEALYVVFRITPYAKKIQRSLTKEPKIYFFDWGLAKTPGARLENFVAVMLLKHVTLHNDVRGGRLSLHFVRDRQGHEVDFCIADDGAAEQLYEVKSADADLDRNLRYFHTRTQIPAAQLVRELRQEKNVDGMEILKLFPAAEKFFI